MIKLKMAALVMILLGPSAAAYVSRGWRVERTLPPVLCAQSLLLILVGYFFPFSWGVGLVAALSVAAWLWALIHVGSVRKAAGFFSLPCLLFLLSVPLFYYACSKRVYYSYDEHSHWGLIVKLIAQYNELPRAGRGAPLLMFTYPPAGAMLPSLACALFSYREGIAYFGYGLLTFGLMLGLTPENGKGAQRLGVPLLFLCMMVFFPLSFLRLFSEPVIGLLAAMLVVRRSGERAWIDDAGDCLAAVMLAMMKNTGIVILALMLLARLIARRERGEARRCARMLLLAAAACASYAVYCRVQGIQATASPSYVAQNLKALLDGTISENYKTIPARFVEFFFGFHLSQAGVYTAYGFGTCATVYAFLLLLGGVQIAVAGDRRAALRTWAGIWTANVLYVLMIVLSYFFFFEEWEVIRLNEADRYMILPALWTGLMACSMLLGGQETSRRRLRSAAICATAVVFLPLSHMDMTYHTFVTRNYAYRTIWARDMTDRQAAFLKGELAGQAQPKLLCMGTYDFMSLRYAMADVLNLGLLQERWAQAPWMGDCEAVRAELERGGYSHVFVAALEPVEEQDAPAVIDGRYAPLTQDGALLRENSLYRVEHGEQGGVSLVYVATMPEEVY